MRMTREEAIEIFERKGWWIAQKEILTSKQAEEIIKLNDAVDFALTALRPVSREQVEKVWRGEWVKCKHADYYVCNKCSTVSKTGEDEFCKSCGAPMTDEAVELLMERLEAKKN